MRGKLIGLATVAGALAWLVPAPCQAQTLSSLSATSNTNATLNGSSGASLSTAVSTSTPGQFFTGFTPAKLVTTPVNFGTPLQAGVNYSSAMMPTTSASSFYSSNMIGQAFSNITFPLFRSVAPSVPIVQPGPNNPIQPSSIAPFYTAKQLKQLKGQ